MVLGFAGNLKAVRNVDVAVFTFVDSSVAMICVSQFGKDFVPEKKNKKE